jgi:hypothetical protein
MTVATDLAERTHIKRRLFLRIEGLNYDFWQPHDIAAPAAGGDWRTPLECLEVGSEDSIGLNVRDMTVDLSAMSFGLLNVYDTTPAKVPATNDPNTTYLLAQLFAPGRHKSSGASHTFLREWTGDGDQVDTNATTIYVTHNPTDVGFGATGTAYIGHETFTYTGTGTETGTHASAGETLGKFTGCSKGLYPAVGTTAFGYAYAYPQDDLLLGNVATDGQVIVSTVPYSMIGRMVGLYVVTYDPDDADWQTFADAELLWCGRVSMGIGYSEGKFQLHCGSILEMPQKIPRHTPKVMLKRINLQGPRGCTLRINHVKVAGIAGYKDVSFSGVQYPNPGSVAQVLGDSMQTAAWSGTGSGYIWLELQADSGLYRLNVRGTDGGGYVFQGVDSGIFHPLHALGFRSLPTVICDEDTKFGYVGYVDAEDPPYWVYQPCHLDCNGKLAYLEDTSELPWTNQGDASEAKAHLLVGAPAQRINGEEWDTPYVVSFNGSVATSPDRVTLHTYKFSTLNYPGRHWRDFVGTTEPGGGLEARPVYVMESAPTFIGSDYKKPFELLLYSLLSTGTSQFNHSTYDKLPVELSCAVPAALVDVDSFLRADNEIGNSDLTVRSRYIIDEPVSWLELFKREGKLFGYVLVWRSGQLTCTSVAHATDTYTQTLTASKGAQLHEKRGVTQTAEHVINEWTFKGPVGYEKEREISLRDQNSIDILGITKSLKVDHPALSRPGQSTADLTILLKNEFDKQRAFLAWPWLETEVSLAPTLVNKVFVGDVVAYEDDETPDPVGTGSMSTNALALVTNVSWDYNDWTGSATLLLYDESAPPPWAPAALVDKAATNGGWSEATQTLTLVAHTFGDSGTDSHDGAAFPIGDKLLVYCTHDSDPASPESYGPFEVKTAYNTGTRALVLTAAASMNGFDSTNEYTIVAADYGDAAATQKTSRGTWQAGQNDKKIGSDAAQKYG